MNNMNRKAIEDNGSELVISMLLYILQIIFQHSNLYWENHISLLKTYWFTGTCKPKRSSIIPILSQIGVPHSKIQFW